VVDSSDCNRTHPNAGFGLDRRVPKASLVGQPAKQQQSGKMVVQAGV